MTVVDWNQLLAISDQGGGYEPLPGGTYDFLCTESIAKNASTGKLMYVVKLKVETGPLAGKVLKNNFVVSADNGNAMNIFFRHMSCFGLDRNFFMSNPHPDIVAQSLINRRVRGTVVQKPFQGRMTNEFSDFLPPTGAMTADPNALVGAPIPAPMAPMAPPMAPAPVPVPMAPPPQYAEQPYPQQPPMPQAPPPMPAQPVPPQAPPVYPQQAPIPPQQPPAYPQQQPVYPQQPAPEAAPQAPAPEQQAQVYQFPAPDPNAVPAPQAPVPEAPPAPAPPAPDPNTPAPPPLPI